MIYSYDSAQAKKLVAKILESYVHAFVIVQENIENNTKIYDNV